MKKQRLPPHLINYLNYVISKNGMRGLDQYTKEELHKLCREQMIKDLERIRE